MQGDFGRIVIYSKSKDDIPVVPQSATLENQEGRYVYVLDEEDIPRMTYIKTAGQTEDGMWIVSSGVKAGYRIVTSGLQKVIPGRAVRIVEKNPESAPVTETKKKNLFDKLIKK